MLQYYTINVCFIQIDNSDCFAFLCEWGGFGQWNIYASNELCHQFIVIKILVDCLMNVCKKCFQHFQTNIQFLLFLIWPVPRPGTFSSIVCDHIFQNIEHARQCTQKKTKQNRKLHDVNEKRKKTVRKWQQSTNEEWKKETFSTT